MLARIYNTSCVYAAEILDQPGWDPWALHLITQRLKVERASFIARWLYTQPAIHNSALSVVLIETTTLIMLMASSGHARSQVEMVLT